MFLTSITIIPIQITLVTQTELGVNVRNKQWELIKSVLNSYLFQRNNKQNKNNKDHM